MTPLQLELTKLIGKKELRFGCYLRVKKWTHWMDTQFFNTVIIDTDYVWDLRRYKTRHPLYEVYEEYISFAIEKQELEIIWHPATLSDLHRWLDSKYLYWNMEGSSYSWKITIAMLHWKTGQAPIASNHNTILYESSKDLLDQDEETLRKIIEFINSNK